MLTTYEDFVARVESLGFMALSHLLPGLPSLGNETPASFWHTGLDPFTDKPVHIARDPEEVKLQRALLQLYEPRNFDYAEKTLGKMKRDDLVRRIRRLKPLLKPV